MISPKGIEKLLRRIMETGGMTEDMEKDIQRLKDEFNERQGILDRYGEKYDGEDDDYEWQPKPLDDYRDEYNQLNAKYQDLVNRYNTRFFAGGDAHITDTELDESENEVPDSTEENVTVDDLLVDVK